MSEREIIALKKRQGEKKERDKRKEGHWEIAYNSLW